jgi:hypothetical protein
VETLGAAHAELGQFDLAIKYQTQALQDPSFDKMYGPAGRQRLELYKQKKPFRQ